MSSLADGPELVGFFSYSREDDEDSQGALSALRSRIQGELRGQLGRTAKTFRLWQDKEAIPSGTLWQREIKNAVGQAAFFIPIITPTVLASPYCRFELDAFLAREAELGRDDLVFPILYIDVPGFEDSDRQQSDSLISIFAKRQYVDWRKLRHRDVRAPEVSEAVERFCTDIRDALRRPWLSPEERQQQEEAASRQRLAETERAKQQTEARRAAEERARQEVEASKRAEEEQRREQAEEQERRKEAEAAVVLAQRRAEEERRAQRTEAERLAAEQRAFAAAKREDSVAAIDEFLRVFPASQFAAEANGLRTTLLAREQAYQTAMRSKDPADLHGFLKRFPSGKAAAEVRSLLNRIEPRPPQQTSRRALVAGGVAAIGVAGIAAAVVMTGRTSAPAENEPAPNPKPPPPPGRLVHVLSGSTQPVELATFNHDGGRILTQNIGGISDTRLWNVNAGSLVVSIPREAGGTAIFSPDGTRILVWDWFNGSGQLQLWEAQTGSLVATLSGHTKKLNGVRFSPDSGLIVTASDDQTARVWDGHTGGLIVVLKGLLGDSAAVTGASFSSDGKLIVTASADGTARVWTKSGLPLTTLPVSASAQNARIDAIFNPAGDLVLTTSNKVAQLWKASTGGPFALSSKPVATLGHSPSGFDSPLFSSDGSRILTVLENTARLWDGRTGAPIATLSGHTDRVRTYKFNRDGTRIVTVGEDVSPRLWNGKSGAAVAVLSGHTDTVFANFTPDGSIVSTESWDKTTRLWNAESGTAIATVTNANEPGYTFSSDSGRMVTVVLSADPKLRSFDAYTSTAQLVETKTGAVFATLSGHADSITHAEFSPDGKLAVTASKDKTARIWDATNTG